MTTTFTPPPPPPEKFREHARAITLAVRRLAGFAATLALALVAENAAAQSAPGTSPALGIQSASATVFSATPDDGYFVQSWSADCTNADSAGSSTDPAPKRCVLAAPVPGGVSVFFAPVGRPLVLKSTPNAGTLSAEWPGGTGRDGDQAPRQTAVTLVADPDLGYYVSEWTGDLCQSAPTGADDSETGLAKKCAVPAAGAISVSVAFARQRDCLSENRSRGDSVSTCGECNRRGFFALSDEAVCEQGREIVLQSSGDGTLFAEWAGDDDLQSGDAVSTLTAVTLSAKPGGDDYVSEWGGDCASSPTGEDDQSGGMDKTCVVPAGTSTLSVSVAFVPSVECGSNRHAPKSVSECGECTANHFAESKDETCVQGWEFTFAAIQNGTLSASWRGMTLNVGDYVAIGSTITLSAEPAAGYYVSAWTGCETTEDNTGSSTDGDPKECELGVTRELRVGVVFSQQAASDTQRIKAADVVAYCAAAGGFRDTDSLDVHPDLPGISDFDVFEPCRFYTDPSKTCYSLEPGITLTSSHAIYDEGGQIDLAHTCDSRHPECGTGMKQRIEDNPLSGCVAEE